MVIDINDEETKKLRFACCFTNCLDYGKTWGHKHSVYNHWQNEHIDTLENPVLCSHCPKKFVSTIMLNMHIKERHNQELRKRFSCSICGATKAKLAILKNHEKTHETAKLFSCEYCDYKTNTEFNRRAHVRYMHAEKLGVEQKFHQCEQCGYSTKNSKNLKDHMESAHSDNLKPDPKYQCHICHKQLKQDNSYRKHMANVHGIGERCEICNKLYRSKEVLAVHIKKMHID